MLTNQGLPFDVVIGLDILQFDAAVDAVIRARGRERLETIGDMTIAAWGDAKDRKKHAATLMGREEAQKLGSQTGQALGINELLRDFGGGF